ncbi:MAG: transposase [Acidobacteriota bacterium]|nr:MAG: transposase [Acidobacteriota bacterium]
MGGTWPRSAARTKSRHRLISSGNRCSEVWDLSTNWFLPFEDAREKIEAFREDYNSFRLHSLLCDLTPDEVVADYLKEPDFSILERY